MLFDFNTFNKPYPAEEFLEDIEGVEMALLKKADKTNKSFKIDMGNSETREYKFNTEHPLHKESQYFQDKYKNEEGARRHLRFRCVWDFIHKNENLLIQNGLMKKEYNKVLFIEDFDDFLSFLINVKVNPKDGEIPRKAIKLYFQSKI